MASRLQIVGYQLAGGWDGIVLHVVVLDLVGTPRPVECVIGVGVALQVDPVGRAWAHGFTFACSHHA